MEKFSSEFENIFNSKNSNYLFKYREENKNFNIKQISSNFSNIVNKDISVKKSRTGPTIGLLINNIHKVYNVEIWNGIKKAVDEVNGKLINFIGKNFINLNNDNSQSSKDNHLPHSKRIDGFLAISTLKDSNNKKVKYFLESFNSIPLVCVGKQFINIPCVRIDNEIGIRKLISHLITEHGYKKIVFMYDPRENEDVKIKLKIYKDVLKSHGIPINPELIISGIFISDFTKKTVLPLLDNKKVDFDALIGSNDDIAFQIIIELQNRGIKVPDDVAVVGFGDIMTKQNVIKMLTTVKQPVYELGYKSAQMLFSILNGNKQITNTVIPANLVIRKSCGCDLHQSNDIIKIFKKFSLLNSENKDYIAKEYLVLSIVEKINIEFNIRIKSSLVHRWARLLLTTLIKAIKKSSEKYFLNMLEKIIKETILYKIYYLSWNDILLFLFNEILQKIKIEMEDIFVQNFFKKSVNVLHNTIIKKFESSFFKINNNTNLLTQLKKRLNNLSELKEIKIIINKYFFELGIKSCFISIYKNSIKNDSSKYSKMLVAYKDIKIININKKNRIYSSTDIIPDYLYNKLNNNPYFIYPISCKCKQIGFIILEVDDNYINVANTLEINLNVYEALVIDLVKSIKKVLIYKKRKKQIKSNKTILFNDKYRKYNLSRDMTDIYYKKLLDFMEKNMPYLDPELSLDKLAKMLDISRHNLSYIINAFCKVKFYDFLNSYRVRYAKKHLIDYKSKNINILDVAYNSGFISKSTFYRTFKNTTQMTPLEFKKKISNKSIIESK